MQRIYLFIVLLVTGLTACKKDSGNTPDAASGSRLTNVIADNFNTSIFNAALTYTHLGDTLLRPGPYTVLVPDDNAFKAAGYGDAVAVEGTNYTLMQQITAYHILGGTYYLDELPLAFNQEIRTLDGDKLYVTHWINGTDTVLVINGIPVISSNLPASNGIIQVLSAVLSPPIYTTIHQALAADQNLSFFNEAMNRTGLTDSLASGVYTVFAPTNSAFQALGFPSTDSIKATDPAALTALLKYHVLSGRRFVYDYVLTTGPTGASTQTMLNGNNITVQLTPDPSAPGKYAGIKIQGAGNASAANLVHSNILAGNGVVHTIDQVLKLTF